MNLLKLGAGVLNQTPMDWSGNFDNIVNTIKEAKKREVSILCLPELCISGYGCEDMFYAEHVLSQSLEKLHQILPHTKGLVLCVGLPLAYRNRIFNASCLIVDEEIKGFVAKRFLAGNGIHYEPRWFTPWPENEIVEVTIPDLEGKVREYPLGDLFFNINGLKIGFEICEDAWVANRPGRKLYTSGVDIILNPSASHFAFDKFETRKRFVLEGSRAFGTAYVYANLLGNESGRAIYDGGALIASSGKMLVTGPRLSFHDYLLSTANVDIDAARMAQAQASTVFNIPKMQFEGVKVDYTFKPVPLSNVRYGTPTWEKSERIQEEEFWRVEALALFDYLRKSRSHGFVVSLSGGADSAAVAVLCRMMVREGVRQLGMEGFKKKLGYLTKVLKAKTEAEIAAKLLTTAYQATENSSKETKRAARELAKGLEATHYELNVGTIHKNYLRVIENAIKRKLSWKKDDITLQNIQARVRAPSIWMFANLQNSLLLSTSNRSEAAVGYATMDGDTSGGLSPIAGIDKHFLRLWLRWIEKEGPTGQKYKISSLRYVNAQKPTAELRPETENQTDEDDLMPYDILDYIEELAIRDKKSPQTCYEMLKMRFSKYTAAQHKEWVKRFFQLWSRNQWKRERYAPSFHLDDKNLDPKTWCRFPILSGGYREELARLKD